VKFKPNGAVTVLLGGGEQMLSPAESKELVSLLDRVKQQGRGSPELVLSWLREKPRRLESLLAAALAEKGYLLDCPLCQRGADARRYSVARARRLFGIALSRQQLQEHRRHARRRSRLHSVDPGRPEIAREAWEPPPPSQREQGKRLLRG
jgi:hypothetical protein